MTLTLGDAPLSTQPRDSTNYSVEGPRHRLLAHPFPRRVRATFSGTVVFDTEDGMLLHESNLLPVLYVPDTDLDHALLTPTDTTTHCPFKGDASYWSVSVGDRTAPDAAWGYPEPMDDARFLTGHKTFYWDRLDEWFDEDELVHGHLRDPYHRVDARRSSRRVVVTRGDLKLADSVRPVVLSETGLPNRWYLPIGDVNRQQLTSSTTTTHCAYKGDATYWSLRDGSGDDIAWSYENPYSDALAVRGYVCFDGDDIETTVGS